MKTLRKAAAALLALALAACLAACGGTGAPATDPSGEAIDLPQNVQRVVSLAPSFTETLIHLGCAERIVGIDTQTQSYGYEALPADLPAFDMMAPDCEQIAALQPDVVLVSGVTDISGNDMYAPLKTLGICVVNIPSPDSIQGIKDDILFLASCVDKTDEGKAIVEELEQGIEAIRARAEGVSEKKSVYFEISAAPYCYSFGSGTFLNEMIELAGGVNVFADQSGWLNVEEESAIAADPQVIFTSVNYIDDPVGEICARSGWQAVQAVAEGQVYYVDNRASSLPNENILLALEQMSRALYPQLYEDAAA